MSVAVKRWSCSTDATPGSWAIAAAAAADLWAENPLRARAYVALRRPPYAWSRPFARPLISETAGSKTTMYSSGIFDPADCDIEMVGRAAGSGLDGASVS